MKKVAVNLRLVHFCLTLFTLNKKNKKLQSLNPKFYLFTFHSVRFCFILSCSKSCSKCSKGFLWRPTNLVIPISKLI